MATTVPEIIGRRFGGSSHLITSILSMLATITLAGVQITATATIISVLTGLSTEFAILICGAVLVIYTMSGGMWSVTMTDVIHFFVLVGGFSLAVPFVLHNVGGWETVVAKWPRVRTTVLRREGRKNSRSWFHHLWYYHGSIRLCSCRVRPRSIG